VFQIETVMPISPGLFKNRPDNFPSLPTIDETLL